MNDEIIIRGAKQHNLKNIDINLPKNKSNLFFGNPFCLEIVRRFSNKELSKLSPYEDFILGIMLGYSRNEQYHRVLSRI